MKWLTQHLFLPHHASSLLCFYLPHKRKWQSRNEKIRNGMEQFCVMPNQTLCSSKKWQNCHANENRKTDSRRLKNNCLYMTDFSLNVYYWRWIVRKGWECALCNIATLCQKKKSAWSWVNTVTFYYFSYSPPSIIWQFPSFTLFTLLATVSLPATIVTSSVPTSVAGHMMYPSHHAVMYASAPTLTDGGLAVLNAFSQSASAMQVSHAQAPDTGQKTLWFCYTPKLKAQKSPIAILWYNNMIYNINVCVYIIL